MAAPAKLSYNPLTMKLLPSLLAACVAACHTSTIPSDGNLPFQARIKGLHSGQAEPGAWLINSEDEWRGFFVRNPAWQQPGETVPGIDLTNSSAIIVSGGQRSTAGWQLEVLGVQLHANRIQVRAEVVGPGPDAIVAMMLTTPWQVITIPRCEGSVALELSERRGQ